MTLVRGNARLTLWGVLTATVAAPIGQGLNWPTGTPSVTLRVTAVVYLAGTVFALRLPSRVDSSEGEVAVAPAAEPQTRPRRPTPGTSQPIPDQTRLQKVYRRMLPPLRGVGPRMTTMLRACAGMRAFTGFLTLFLAFLIRSHPLGVFSPTVDLGIIIAAGGARQCARHDAGRLAEATPTRGARDRQPDRDRGHGRRSPRSGSDSPTAALAILIANIARSLSKLGLDSVIQRDAVEHVRTSAFARSETVLQLSWVLGGFLAIVLPSNGSLASRSDPPSSLTVLLSTTKVGAHARAARRAGIELLRERRRPARAMHDGSARHGRRGRTRRRGAALRRRQSRSTSAATAVRCRHAAGDVHAFHAGVGPVAAAATTAVLLALGPGYEPSSTPASRAAFAGRVEIGDVVLADRSSPPTRASLTDAGFLSACANSACPARRLRHRHSAIEPGWLRGSLQLRGGELLTLSCMTGTGRTRG